MNQPEQSPGSSMSRRQALVAAATLAFCGCAGAPAPRRTQPASPVLPLLETQRRVHGRTLRDPYGWVDDAGLDDPRIAAFLRAHREHAARVMGPLEPLVQSLMQSAAAREGAVEGARAVRHGDWRYRAGEAVRGGWALVRLPLETDAPELVLSVAAPASVPMWGATEDGRRVAYAVRTGPEQGLIRVRDVTSGDDLPDVVDNVRVNIDLTLIVWSRDGLGFFYSDVDAAGRPWRARFHRVGTPQAADRVLFEEPDPAFFVVVRRTSSGAFAIIASESTTASEVRLVPLDAPDAPPIVVRQRAQDHAYVVDESGGELLILTNDLHPNRRLVSAPVSQPDRWREVLPASDATGLVWHHAFDRQWVVLERSGGLDRIRVIDRQTGTSRLIEFPDVVYTAGFDRWSAGPEVNSRSDAGELLIGYQSFVRPKRLYRHQLETGAFGPVAAEAADPESARYVVERLFAESVDGARVPISLLRRADRSPAEHRGVVLYGYGAYGMAVQPTFDASRLGLLDHGVMFALAHVRGGSDQGGAWAEAGQGKQRDRPIVDFIACAKHLVTLGYVKAGAIVAEGHSAGAWLAAASANLAPELFAATLLHVPYVDVLTDLLSPTSTTAESERMVSGDPVTDAAALELLVRIDPYRTLPLRGARPAHITGVVTDQRVAWRGIVKYAGRASAADAAPVVVQLADDGSHWAPADAEVARRWPHERYAFAISCLTARR